jgi:hypothetical protein
MKVDPKSISSAVNASFEHFAQFRRARSFFLSAMVGRFYGKNQGFELGDQKASPLNLMNSAVATMVPNLVYNDPRVKVRTDVLAYKAYAETLELAANHLVREINLRETLRQAVVDSVFLAGFVKTGLAAGGGIVDIEGDAYEVGQPFAERVDPDDIILDPMARDWQEQAFIGNRFRVDMDDLQASGLYDADELEKAYELTSRYDGAGQSVPGAEQLGGKKSNDEEYRRYIDLADIYLPAEQIIVTLPVSPGGLQDKFLRVADYDGPETGPYHMLGYQYVPDNLLPCPPASTWYDLHVLGNRIARKLARQADRLKRVLAYEPSSTEDVNAIADADDGETVPVENIQAIREVQYGGTGDEAYSWMDWVKQNFSEQAGNLDMLSGSGSDAPTATQAELLHANTSVRLADMQNQVYQFAAHITRDLAFFLHTDPLIELPLIRRREGVEEQVVYTPEMREGDWFDFNLDIEPYSMSRPDPNKEVRRKIEFATNVVPAAAQAMALLGPGFDVGAYLKRMAHEVGINDADEWLNTPEMQEWTMRRLMMSTVGDPGKAQADLAAGIPTAPQPNQPVPTATGPAGGVSPSTETASAQQETAAESQRGMEPSARSLALSRG